MASTTAIIGPNNSFQRTLTRRRLRSAELGPLGVLTKKRRNRRYR